MHDWSDDPRLTAYALGELGGEEARELEAQISGDEAAQALVAELRTLGEALEQGLAGESAPALKPEQWHAIEERLGAPTAPSAINRKSVAAAAGIGWRGWFAVAATVVGLGVGATFVLRPGERFGSLPAPAHESEELARQTDSRAYLERLRGLGYIGADPGEGGKPTPAELGVQLQSLGYAGGPGTPVPSGIAARSHRMARGKWTRVEGERDQEALRAIGYSGGDGEEPLMEQVFFDDLSEKTLQDLEQLGEGNREGYDPIVENPFRAAGRDPLSTFSVDVDTAAYSNLRRFLGEDRLPPADAVRIEELVNYFPYTYPAPTGEHPFSVDLEVGSCPWKQEHRLVRIGLQGRETLPEERRSSNLVFLLDVSGSMNSDDKLPLLKRALQMLVQELDERDRIAIVVYAGSSGLVLPPTSCDRSVDVHMALERLKAGGSTNGGAGIELAYEVAARNYIDGGINRVILATDGDFNVGVSDDGSLVRLIEEKAKTGVFLSVLGFGRGNLQDAKMEKLADKGNGNYAYIDSVLEAKKVLVEQMGATLETIAKDVKIQVEFNPREVQAWRLIGYENRLLAAQDFNDDTKDAGEIGAGHRVTALYEVVPVGVPFELPGVDPLKYQAPASATGEAFGGELLTVKFRYKRPEGERSTLLSETLVDEGADFQELSADTRWAASVAAFGMVLRGSAHVGEAGLPEVSRWALESAADDPGGYRAQFIGLVAKARELRGR